MSVEIAFTSGVTLRRSIDHNVIGKVFWRPVKRYVTAISSKEMENAIRTAPSSALRMLGQVTHRNTSHGLAPRSSAASSRLRPTCCNCANTSVMVTHMRAVPCPKITVCNESLNLRST